jgi:hypothetical protein
VGQARAADRMTAARKAGIASRGSDQECVILMKFFSR